jgi:hypothetical protein
MALYQNCELEMTLNYRSFQKRAGVEVLMTKWSTIASKESYAYLEGVLDH